MVFKPRDRPVRVEVQRRRRRERLGLRADGLQRWAVERLMEAKRSRSGGVWGLARFVGHAAADDLWVRLIDMSITLRAEAKGLLPVRRRRLSAAALEGGAGVRRSGRVPGAGGRSVRAVAAWERLVTRATALSVRKGAGLAADVMEVEEGCPVAAVLRWKRVKGKLVGLVRWEPDPVTGEFPPEWKGEGDLGADLVSEGRTWLSLHGGSRARRRASSSSAARRRPAAQATPQVAVSPAGPVRASGRDGRAEARDAKRAASAAPARKRGLRSPEEGWPAGRRARVGVGQGVVLERGGSGTATKRGGGDGGVAPLRRVSAREQQRGGAKRDYGEGSPSGSSVAARAAVESVAVVSRRESTRSRRALWAEAGSTRD